MKGEKPMKVLKDRGISVNLWRNVSKDGKVEFKSITIQRSYRTGETWGKTNSFPLSDAPKVAEMLSKLYSEEGIQSK